MSYHSLFSFELFRSLCFRPYPVCRVFIRPGIDRSIVLMYLLDQIDSLLEIHAEVNKCPFNALALVLLLLEDEHVVVEELLQLLVGEIDAQLLETVELLDRVAQRSGRGPMRTGGLSEEQRKKKQGETAVINAV